MLGDLADGLELPLAFIRSLQMVKQERQLGRPLTDDDRKILWAAEQGLRLISSVRLVLEAEMLLPEPVAVRGVIEEVSADFGQFWRLVGERPAQKIPREQLLVDVNRQALKCFLATLLAESLRFERSGQLFVTKAGGLVLVGVRDFGPALPRNFAINAAQTLPLRPKSRQAFLVISELVRAMHSKLGQTSHRDGVSFFVELPVSRQASLL